MTAGADSPEPRRAVHTRNRRGRGTCLRADILAAATGLVDRGGERAVTLRAVARQAGIAAPSIYPHFPDRPAIVRAVARQALAELSWQLSAARDAAGDDAEQRLYAACRAYLDFAAAHPLRYRALFGGFRNPEFGRDVPDDLSLLVTGPLAALTDAIAGCVAVGRSASTDPFADAVALWLGLHGLAHQRVVSHAFPRPVDPVRRIVAPLSRITRSRSGGVRVACG